jgi:hypothetical protein
LTTDVLAQAKANYHRGQANCLAFFCAYRQTIKRWLAMQSLQHEGSMTSQAKELQAINTA